MRLRILCHLLGCTDPENYPYVMVYSRCGVAEHVDEFSGEFIYEGWIPWVRDKLHAAGVCLNLARCETCLKPIGRLRILWRHIINSDVKWHCDEECLKNDIPF